MQFRFFHDAESTEFLYTPEDVLADSLQIDALVNARLIRLYSEGFLNAGYRKSSGIDQQLIDFYVGDVYHTAAISAGNMPADHINKWGYSRDRFQDKPFSWLQIVKIIEASLDYAENWIL
jgi:hypothetical protein